MIKRLGLVFVVFCFSLSALAKDLEYLNSHKSKLKLILVGTITGFEITYIKKGGVFDDTLGLKVGEQLLDVNNIPLDSVSAVMKLLNQFKNSSIINLGLKRKGAIRNIRYLAR